MVQLVLGKAVPRTLVPTAQWDGAKGGGGELPF